jgi:hypothetical protein
VKLSFACYSHELIISVFISPSFTVFIPHTYEAINKLHYNAFYCTILVSLFIANAIK